MEFNISLTKAGLVMPLTIKTWATSLVLMWDEWSESGYIAGICKLFFTEYNQLRQIIGNELESKSLEIYFFLMRRLFLFLAFIRRWSSMSGMI